MTGHPSFVSFGIKTIAAVFTAMQSSRAHSHFTGWEKLDRRRKGRRGQCQSWGERRDGDKSTTERQQKVRGGRSRLMNKLSLFCFDMSYLSLSHKFSYDWFQLSWTTVCFSALCSSNKWKKLRDWFPETYWIAFSYYSWHSEHRAAWITLLQSIT